MLDTIGLNWSSFDTGSGIGGLSGQRCLHTAISVTGEDMDNAGDTQQGDPTSSPSSPAAGATGDAASPPTQRESIDVAAAAGASGVAPGVRLWNPAGPAGRATVPVSARSAGSDKGAAAGGLAAKKKAGAKEGATASKKAGSKEAAKNSGGSGGVDCAGDGNVDGAGADVDCGDPPVYERILVFGGIVDEAAVSGVSYGWT